MQVPTDFVIRCDGRSIAIARGAARRNVHKRQFTGEPQTS